MNGKLTDMSDAPQVLCLGRAGLDLYANELDTPFTDVTGFHKHVGGSPANIAQGLAKLGVSTGFIGRLSDDMVGHYVNDSLQRAGIDVSGVVFDDSGTRTSLALTEMRAEGCGVVIYRHQAADLALAPGDLNADAIAAARLLLISGTALAARPSRDAALSAMQIARNADTQVVLDLDYRAYTWASEQEASALYKDAVKRADVVIGNTEEMALLMDRHADGSTPDEATVAKALHDGGVSLVCYKAGADGSTAWQPGAEPVHQPAYTVKALKPFGAGDAYAALVCRGLLMQEPITVTLPRAAAAAAMVVASTSCGDATPALDEIDNFIGDAARAQA